MHRTQRNRKLLLISSSVLMLVLFGASLVVARPSLPILRRGSSTTAQPLLPGQRVWKHGISSFLFGTNDGHEFSSQNIQTQPAIRRDLRNAGFTLMRSFFPDNASDATIEQNMRTIENSGTHCLGVITNIFNAPFDEHLVRYLGHRCLMYEFGNE